MKANPRDWRIEALQSVADAFGLVWRQPGGSHVIFRHPRGAMLSVPARRPIKPVYVRKFVRLVEEGVAE
jgi:predicted RNA binding protein YcfA (HicA-like mRNA interferase family)